MINDVNQNEKMTKNPNLKSYQYMSQGHINYCSKHNIQSSS